jgi:hypothetical protein
MRELLYVTSSRDGWLRDGSVDRYYAESPFGHAAALFSLRRLGWSVRCVGFWGSLNPLGLRRRVRGCKPQVVLTNGVTSLSPIMLRGVSTRMRCPIVFAWDDYYSEIWRANFGRFAGLFMTMYERQIVRRSDHILTISHYNQQRAQGWGKRTWFVPNGCDVPEFDVDKCPIRLDGAMNLVYSGDQARYKRTYEVVQAMAKLPKNIKLYLTGHPYEYLKPCASENVVFLGYLSKNDMWSVIDQADVCVCTADQDCNAKFHEYLRMKKPILGYDGKPNWLFKNRHNALLTKDYVSAIMELSARPDWRRELAENAAREIPVYTWREIAQQWDVVFGEILELYHGGKNG